MSEQLLKEILSAVQSMDKRLERVEGRLERVEGQLEENTTILRALEHRSQVQGAEIEGLTLSTATKESIQQLSDKLEAVYDDLSYAISKVNQHDRSIFKLNKLAK